jgi:hypothetical protein
MSCNASHLSSDRERNTVARVVCPLKLPGRFVAQGGVQVMLVVVIDPGLKDTGYYERTGPLVKPEAFLFQRTHHSLGVRVALRVVIAGKRLLDPQGLACLHECRCGGLTAVVTHQEHTLPPSSGRALTVHRHIQGDQPLPYDAGDAGIVPHDLFRVPVQDQDDIDPARALYQDLSHVDPPSLVRSCEVCSGSVPRGLQATVRPDQEVMLPHQTQNALFVDHTLLHKAQVCPNAAVAPEGMLGLQRLDAREQAVVALDDPQ